jgi:hypothetical protein
MNGIEGRGRGRGRIKFIPETNEYENDEDYGKYCSDDEKIYIRG